MNLYKRIAITFIVFISILFGTGFYISSIYEEEVKSYILNEINSHLNTKIDIEEINFSVLKKFPYASLEFKNVRADEISSKKKKEDLFKIKSIYFQFNIIDIIRENYVIKQIAVEDGFVNVKIDKKGNDNFHIWKNDTTSTTKPFKIELTKLVFDNISLTSTNDFKNIDFLVLVEQVNLSGNFSEINYTLNTKAKLLMQQLNSNNQSWIKNKKINLSTSLSVQQDIGKYTIKNGEISIEDLIFNLSGNFINNENSTMLSIVSKGNDLSIESIFSLFPPEQQEKLKSYQSKGNITYHAKIKGMYSSTQNPDFEAYFSIKNGEILEKNSTISLTQISLDGSYINKKGALTKLILQNFNANFGAGHITGNYTITDFNNPSIEFKSIATIDILSAKNFFKLDTLEIANGQLNLNVAYAGYIKEITNIKAKDFQQLKASGQVSITNGNLKLVNYPYLLNGLNGSFQFNNNEIIIDSLATNINSSYIDIHGSFKNLLAYLFVDGQKLLVDATFYSKKIILDELLSNSSSGKKDTVYTLKLPNNLSFHLNAKVDTFMFRKFKAENFTAQLVLQNKQFTATNLSFNAMHGKINGDFYMDDTNENEIIISSTADIKTINIKELFDECENFGQEYFVSDNIKGVASTTLQFASVWSKNLELNRDKLYVLADLTIYKGELINYKPALALGKFIEMSELNDIKFSTLQTQIEIKDQLIQIPKTEIKSSALDLTISGTHSFDNAIDYRFKLLMNDVLWKKAKSKKKENSEFGYVEDDGLGKAALFLHMTGTVENYKITYDTKSLKEKWGEDIKAEKQTLKQILKEEFGWFKKDSTLNDNKKPKKDGFLMEWEEDTRNSQKNTKDQKTKDAPTDKKGVGKLIDKIAKPNADEFEKSDEF